MINRRDFVIFVLVTYLVLIIWFFAKEEKKFDQKLCAQCDYCIRACSNLDGRESDLFGKFHCSAPSTPLQPGIFELTNGQISRRVDLEGEICHFDSDMFYLEQFTRADDGTFLWAIGKCKKPDELREKLHIYLMTATWTFIVATLTTFVWSKSFKIHAGCCELMFLLGLWLFFTVYLLKNYENPEYAKITDIALELASLVMLLWLTVLSFDIWWTFRFQLIIHDDLEMFGDCFFFVFGFIGFIFLLRLKFWMIFGFFSIINFVLLMFTGYKISTLSKSSKISDQSWIEAQKERFCSYLGVCFILMINYPFDIFSLEAKYSVGSTFAVDFMKLFSGIFIFLIFGYKKIVISLRQPVAANEEIL